MSNARSKASDELRPEYDFETMPGGVRGKRLRRYRAGTNLALLDPDVAPAFPTDEAVNEALRTVLKAATAMRRTRRSSNRALQRPAGAGKVSDRPGSKRRAGRRSVPALCRII
jgi:hypothetical protein